MDAVRKKLLSRTGLPGNQHIGRGLAELFGHLHLVLHDRTHRNDIPKRVLGAQSLLEQSPADLALLL